MASKTSAKRNVLAELFSNREANIKEALSWTAQDIEDQLKRAKIAKEGFLAANPMHDLSIIEEHISQLEEAFNIKSTLDSEI